MTNKQQAEEIADKVRDIVYRWLRHSMMDPHEDIFSQRIARDKLLAQIARLVTPPWV